MRNTVFLSRAERVRVRRAARCHGVVARGYLRREGLNDPEVWAAKPVSAHQAAIFAAIDQALGDVTPSTPQLASLRCERYLLDAVSRWVTARCRTASSAKSYIAVFRAWVLLTVAENPSRPKRQLRTLCRHIGADQRQVETALLIWEREVSPRTVANRLAVLRSWFAWLAERGHRQDNPISPSMAKRFRVVDHARVERGAGRRESLTETQARDLVRWCLAPEQRPTVGLSVLLQVVGGLRSAEVAAAKLSDLRLDEGRWRLTVRGKGRRSRLVWFEPALVAAWNRYRQSSRRTGQRGALLRRPNPGGHYPVCTIQRWAKAALAAVNRQDLSSHDLRRTAGTIRRMRGMQIDSVARFLGHASVSTTLRCYVTEAPDDDIGSGYGAITATEPAA